MNYAVVNFLSGITGSRNCSLCSQRLHRVSHCRSYRIKTYHQQRQTKDYQPNYSKHPNADSNPVLYFLNLPQKQSLVMMIL